MRVGRLTNYGETPWESRRGLATSKYNNTVVFIRAPIAEAAKALRVYADRTEEFVIGREIALAADRGAFLFQIQGHVWTTMVFQAADPAWQAGEARTLSQDLKTRVITYSVSNTARSTSYSIFYDGELLEEFSASEDGTGLNDPKRIFSSRLRDLNRGQITNIWDFANQFLIQQDALEPGIDFNYFLRGQMLRPGGAQLAIANPGFERTDSMGRASMSVPPIERADYLVLTAAQSVPYLEPVEVFSVAS